MSLVQQRRKQFWAKIDNIVKGCGRGLALKRIVEVFGPAGCDEAGARAILKRYRENRRARPRKVVAGWSPE
jgi:hypothetical protein